MDEMILEFDIVDQTLTRTDTKQPVENSNGYLKAHFNLPTGYSGTISAYIERRKISGNVGVIMPVDNQTGLCSIPDGMIKSGTIYISISSTDTDIFVPTNSEKVIIGASGIPLEIPPSPGVITDQYAEFEAMYNSVNDNG